MSGTVTQWQTPGRVADTWDRPLRDLRISVIDRCNYRCPYCMPADIYGEGYEFLPRRHWLTAGEIKRVAGLFMQLGVTKIRITGGEPLLRRDVIEIVGSLNSLPGLQDLALTTNGSRLAAQAQELRKAGLKRITVSLDSLDEGVFRTMNGDRGGVAQVLEGIDEAQRAGLAPIKLNVVIQKGKNEHTALDLLEHFRGTGIIVRFIEYMDVGTLNGWRMDEVVTSKTLLERISARWPLTPVKPNYRGEVARRYAFEDGQGEVGFISSVSEPFCGDCHRARLSADGTVYTCLFAKLGTSLREPLRAGASDADLIGLLQSTWRGRTDRYSERRGREGQPTEARVEMYRMGG
ncbi:MAG: GTP 3',8-cyclase MoaA [Rhodospirillaceae bacterium]|nr:GTP 3',8-cyclase MoaA [Rhodospirillaceae bacterium]MDE0359949.1 GTP 3',8-cyclase MoaA [Rhodospirillaceae bacterium]